MSIPKNPLSFNGFIVLVNSSRVGDGNTHVFSGTTTALCCLFDATGTGPFQSMPMLLKSPYQVHVGR